MCNLYSYKMTAAEMRALKLHYQFIGTTWTEWKERQRQQNEPIEDVYAWHTSVWNSLRSSRMWDGIFMLEGRTQHRSICLV